MVYNVAWVVGQLCQPILRSAEGPPWEMEKRANRGGISSLFPILLKLNHFNFYLFYIEILHQLLLEGSVLVRKTSVIETHGDLQSLVGWELGPRQGLRGPTFCMKMCSFSLKCLRPSPCRGGKSTCNWNWELHHLDVHSPLGPGHENLCSILNSRTNTHHIGQHLWAQLPQPKSLQKMPSREAPKPSGNVLWEPIAQGNFISNVPYNQEFGKIT